MNIRRLLMIGVGVLAALFLLLQVVPLGRARENPPVVAEPDWDSPRTRELAARACFDCHSNQTAWPWYSAVAPVSWVVGNHVVEGREHVNFSDWFQSHEEHGEDGHEAEELVESVLDGEMPPQYYLLTHPEARLTEAERAALIAGLEATAGRSPVPGAAGDQETGEGHDEDDD